ncbi:Uncharacterized protein FWK35_00010678 [Aphis craccivora]|uniref:Uncharacterized protein n=1 Tax=Aphis craccivora TaxID=307492 RepID=A0A6G0YH68_APHCR|nr:Uncharacterized protein FWK35_00010678 [Aphis craccivora]
MKVVITVTKCDSISKKLIISKDLVNLIVMPQLVIIIKIYKSLIFSIFVISIILIWFLSLNILWEIILDKYFFMNLKRRLGNSNTSDIRLGRPTTNTKFFCSTRILFNTFLSSLGPQDKVCGKLGTSHFHQYEYDASKNDISGSHMYTERSSGHPPQTLPYKADTRADHHTYDSEQTWQNLLNEKKYDNSQLQLSVFFWKN